MKRFLLVTVFAAALCAGYASSALFAGTYFSECDPYYIGEHCAMLCGQGIGNVCPNGSTCTWVGLGGQPPPVRSLCVGSLLGNCKVSLCSKPAFGAYVCNPDPLRAPCDCTPPNGTC
jgi:hypothetical protein